MPFMTNPNPCKICGEVNKVSRYKFQYINKKYYLQKTCKDCETVKFQEYQKKNLDKFREYNKKSHLVKVGGSLSRRSTLEMTDTLRKEYQNSKVRLRCTRAKQARVLWNKELTDFIYKEAHALRELRNKLTSFEWHVDHIIPLKGKNVCGLHVYNNFAVIPKVENLRKGNYYSIHD